MMRGNRGPITGLLAFGVCVALAGCADRPADAERRGDELAAAREHILWRHHDVCVETFVKAEGFGGDRMPIMMHRLGDHSKGLYLPFEPPTDLPPGQVPPEPTTGWMQERVELVSLPGIVGATANGPPGVYPATGMRRAFLRARTRELDDFERQALEALRGGEEMKVQEAPERIRALGAIRIRQECKKCHDKPDGSLLGAFSYAFVSGTPKPPAPPVVPQAEAAP